MADDPEVDPEVETGEPVEIWTDEPGEVFGDEFLGKVRRRIHRRVTSNQMAAFSWHTPGMVLLSLMDVMKALFGSLGGGRSTKDKT